MMKVAVIGTGYVGLTTAVSLAMNGHQVIGVDVVAKKIEQLQRGHSPIFEPGLEEALQHVLTEKTVAFTTDIREATEAQIIYLCVGTPEAEDGEADLTYVLAAVEQIRQLHERAPAERIIVIKSTVPVGTGDKVAELLRTCEHLHVASNPEFLREGSALQDALHPSRIVIGTDDEVAAEKLRELYAGVDVPWVQTTRANAELIKYAANAFLATRISFMNELARLSAVIGTDVSTIAEGIGLDSRIGPQFLRAGLGYGGSCFPKDTIALLQVAKKNGVRLSILEQVREVNRTQPEWFLSQLKGKLPELAGMRIALLGLSFKPDTDDIREAPSLKVIDYLQKEGAQITAYDPVAVESVQALYPDVTYTQDPYDAFAGADAAVLVTEWHACIDLDWAKVKANMNSPLLFDGRNAWPAKELQERGFFYLGVGKSGG